MPDNGHVGEVAKGEEKLPHHPEAHDRPDSADGQEAASGFGSLISASRRLACEGDLNRPDVMVGRGGS